MSRQNTSESAYGVESKKGLHSRAGSRAVSRGRTSTAGSNDGRSIMSGASNVGSETGALTAENLAMMLNKKKAGAAAIGGNGMVWGSDPAACIVGLVKSKKKSDGKEDREERIKKRREELLQLLS